MNRIRVCFTGHKTISEEDCGEVAHALCCIVKSLLKDFNFPQFLFTGEGQFEYVANEFLKGVANDYPHKNIQRFLIADPQKGNGSGANEYDRVINLPYTTAKFCDLVIVYGNGENDETAKEAKRLYKPIIYI